MDYLETLCFEEVNSKRRDFPRKKRKTEIAALTVTTEFTGSRQTSKQMARKLCHNNIFCVATQDLEIGR